MKSAHSTQYSFQQPIQGSETSVGPCARATLSSMPSSATALTSCVVVSAAVRGSNSIGCSTAGFSSTLSALTFRISCALWAVGDAGGVDGVAGASSVSVVVDVVVVVAVVVAVVVVATSIGCNGSPAKSQDEPVHSNVT